MAENNNWAPASLKEAIFWRDGMTPDEYDKEREYYYAHIKQVKDGSYVPLWKQKN